ncbi:Early nodulin-like protein 1 [Linum grandiflorum]
MNSSHQAPTSTSVAMAAAALFVVFFFSNCDATMFKVGDDLGWTTNTTTQLYYTHWATKHRFQVGDSLLFEYKNDSVAKVDEWGYSHCNASSSTAVFNDGKSRFELDKPGPFYFISGDSTRCKKGMLLLVQVMHYHQAANPPEGSLESSPSSSMEPRPPASSASGQPSSAVIVSVIVSSVTVVLIATFVALAWCSP